MAYYSERSYSYVKRGLNGRKLVTNLEINNKNEVSFRWKKPLENVFNQALKNRTRFDAGGRTRLLLKQKSSVSPRSEYPKQVLDILSLRRPVEPSVLILLP